MNKKCIYVSSVIVTSLLIGSASAASTQSQSVSNRQSAVSTSQSSNSVNKNVSKEKFTTEKCTTIQNRLTAKIGGYNKVNNRNYNAFLNMQARLSKVEARLRLEEGLDTSKLKQDIVELDKLIETYSKDYSLLYDELKFSHKKACNNTQGEFQDELTKTREQVKLVHQDRDKVREFYANFIKPDLIALKKQIQEDDADSGATTSDENDSDSTGNSTAENNNQ